MAKIDQILQGTLIRLENNIYAQNFFRLFLTGLLIKEINHNLQNYKVNKETDITGQKAWQAIYYLAVEVVYNAALRNHSEAHPDIFQEAEQAVKALKEELEEKIKIKLESIELKSPTTQMAEAGIVEVKDGLVRLTEKGREVADEVEKIIISSSN